MTYLLFPLFFLSVLCFPNAVLVENALCLELKKAPLLTKHRFVAQDHSEAKKHAKRAVSTQVYEALFQSEWASSHQTFIVGKIPFSEKIVGLVCFNTTIEGDQPFEFFSFHLVENCRLQYTSFLTAKDDAIYLFERSASFSPNYDTLTSTLQHSSEWVDMDATQDTLFTETLKVYLKGAKADTVARKNTWKIIAR